MNKTKEEQHVPPSPRSDDEPKQNGGKMDLYTLLIAKSLSRPKAQAFTNEQHPSQPEAPLPAIDLSLLAEVRREQREEARREGQFVTGTTIRATV
jgi:hypothetical protein